MLVAIVAAVAMFVDDAISVVLVQAEAANHGWLAGICDGAMWGVGILTTTISINAFDGHSLTEKVLVALLVTVANVLGTKAGQLMGKRLLSSARMKTLFRREGLTLEERVSALERSKRGHL
ncbi:MAG TPA: hypothetical protein VF288_10530 [Mycobacteriales bacterium]